MKKLNSSIITAIINALLWLFKLIKHENKKNNTQDTPEAILDSPRIEGATAFVVKLHKHSVDILNRKEAFARNIKDKPVDIIYDVTYEPIPADPEIRARWAQNDPEYQNLVNAIFKSFDTINFVKDPEYLSAIKALFKRTEPCYLELQDLLRPYLAKYNVTL